jgi:UDP-glucose 4-epimerase
VSDTRTSQATRPVCVVTGASGLIGTHLLPRLARTHDVVAVSRRAMPPQPGVTHLTCDLADPSFRSRLPRRADALVHLAQSLRFREFPDGADDMLAINVAATQRLLHWSLEAGVAHATIASSGSVYAPGPKALYEDDHLRPFAGCDFYSATRIAGEALAHAYRSKLPVTVLRFFFVYGAGQERHMLLPRLVDRVRSGTPVFLDGPVGMLFKPTHASDAASGILASVARAPGTTINVCGPESLSLRTVCERIAHRLKVTPEFEVRDTPAADFIACDARMRDALGPATVTFDDGLPTIL